MGTRAQNQQRTSWSEAGEQVGHGLAARGSGEDDLRAAELLQFRSGVDCSAVNVNAGAEFPGERLAFFAAADGGDAIAEFAGELNTEMAEAANSLDRYEIAGPGAVMAQCIVGGNATTQATRAFRPLLGIQ